LCDALLPPPPPPLRAIRRENPPAQPTNNTQLSNETNNETNNTNQTKQQHPTPNDKTNNTNQNNDSDCPETIEGKQVVTLDMGLLVAGTKYRGEFEERLKKLMDEIKQNDDIILM